MILTTQELQKKFKCSLKDLMLHYAAVGGEISSELIEELGIKTNNKNYITRKSNFSGFFVYKKGGGLRGYQLHSKGIDYLLKTNNEYETFVTMNYGKRKVTTDIYKRKRYQRRAWLYHYLDELEIGYFPSQAKSKNFFYCSQVIKKLYTQFGKIESAREYEISSSRLYGTLKLDKDLYNVYVFEDGFDTLSMGVEFRANTLVSQALKKENVETIIFAHSAEGQNKILSEILNAMTTNRKQYAHKQYSFFKQSQQNGLYDIHILNFDDTGKKQLELMKDKEKTKRAIKRSLSKKYSLFTEPANNGIFCDTMILGQPCFFIESLNIYKIKQVYDIVTSEEGVFFYLVCFENHISVIQKLFMDIKVDEYVKFIPIETLEIGV